MRLVSKLFVLSLVAYVAACAKSGSSDIDSIGQQTMASATPLGSCALSDRVVRYYSAVWNLASAQANCATRSGSWTSS
jgi:hypothetical protein